MVLFLKRTLQLWRESFSGLSREVWLLTAVNFVNRCGAMVIAFLPIYLMEELRLDIRSSGFVMSCFGIGSVLGAFIGGKLTDKTGFFYTQFWSLLLNGLVLMAMGFARTFEQMCVMVFLMSFSADIFRPANSTAISIFSDDSNRTRSFSLMRMAFNMGWTICPAIGGILIHWFGWHLMFWIDGTSCVLSALCFFFIFRNKIRNSHKKEEKFQSGDTYFESQSPYKNKKFLTFIVLTFLNAWVFMQILWTIPVFFKESLQFNEAEVGLLMALNGLIVAVVEMPLVFQIENKKPVLHWVRLGLLLYGASYWVLNFSFLSGLVVAILCTIGLSFGEIFVMPFSSNYVTKSANPARQGQYLALYSISYAVANIIAPTTGTQIIAIFGYPTLWWIVGSVAFLDWAGFRWLKL